MKALFILAVIVACAHAKVVGFAGDDDGTVWKVDMDTGSAEILTQMYHDEELSKFGYDPNSGKLLTATYDDDYLLLSHDPATGENKIELGDYDVYNGDSTFTFPRTTSLVGYYNWATFYNPYQNQMYLAEYGALSALSYDGSEYSYNDDFTMGTPYDGGTGDGVGTDAEFNYPTTACFDPNDQDGTMYVPDYYSIRKITTDRTVTTFVGGESSNTEGFGTNAGFYYPNSCAFNEDGSEMYVGSEECVSKVDMATGEVTWLAGCANSVDTAVGLEDGVGTDATISDYASSEYALAGLVYHDGKIYFSDSCDFAPNTIGSVVRQIDPATGEVSPFSGDYIENGCTADVDGSFEFKTGSSDPTKVKYGEDLNGLSIFHEVCGKLFPSFTTEFDLTAEELAACDSLEGGDLPGTVVITGTGIPITTDANIGDAQVNDDGELSVAEGATVNASSIVVAGNGSVFCNGGDIEANSLTLSDTGFFRVLIAKTNNGKGVINGNAKLAGFVVIIVDGAYNWAEGTQNVILTFLTKEGGFKGVKTYTEAPKFGRRLLQAATAAVDCAETACTATSTSEGDDDDVGLLAAVIILGVLIALAVIAAIFIVAKKSSDKNVNQMSAAAAPYNADYSSSSYFGSLSSSSSSSGYSF